MTVGAYPERGPLTPRMVSVLQKAAEGLTADETASEIGVSVHTVKTYRCVVLARLGCRNMAEAVAHGMRTGVIA